MCLVFLIFALQFKTLATFLNLKKKQKQLSNLLGRAKKLFNAFFVCLKKILNKIYFLNFKKAFMKNFE